MMNSQEVKIGPGFDNYSASSSQKCLPGKPKMIPGSLPKVFLRLKMGDACAVTNPAVLIPRAQVPKMHPRETQNDAREPPKRVFAPQNGACMCSIKSLGFDRALFGAKDASPG